MKSCVDLTIDLKSVAKSIIDLMRFFAVSIFFGCSFFFSLMSVWTAPRVQFDPGFGVSTGGASRLAALSPKAVMPRPAFDNPVTFTAGRLDIDGHVHGQRWTV